MCAGDVRVVSAPTAVDLDGSDAKRIYVVKCPG
jgi:hypothetical protein